MIDRTLVLAVVSVTTLLSGCDGNRWLSSKPSTYSACLGDRLRSVQAPQGAAAVVEACRAEFPPGAELARLQRPLPGPGVNGKASVDESYGVGSSFSGTLYNPSTDLVITEVVVKLSNKPPPPDKAASAPDWPLPLQYRVQVVIWPQSAVPFSVPVLPDKNYGSGWGVTEVYGVDLAVARGAR